MKILSWSRNAWKPKCLNRQIDFIKKKLTSKLNFQIKYYFLLIIELHIHIQFQF
jgi:hypothetical protein